MKIMTKDDVVKKYQAAFKQQKEINDQVGAEIASLDAFVEQNGWDAYELMEQAYGL